MASPRPMYGLPAKPSDGFRPRKMQDIGTPSSVPRPLNLKTRKIPEPTRVASEGLSKSRLPSRVPQPSSTQQPSKSQPVARYSDHKSQSGSSTRTVDSTHSRSHTQTASGSSSSVRSYDSSQGPAQYGLRRKKSSVSREPNSPWSESTRTSSTSSLPRYRITDAPGFNLPLDSAAMESPTEMQRDPMETSKPIGQSPVIYPELDRYRDIQRPTYASEDLGINVPFRLATQDLPPPTPVSLLFSGNSSQVSAYSASPSTRFSESPGPGPYSRDTTPTSMSSQSPGLVAPSRFIPPKSRQNSPAQSRPPVTRRRAGSFSNDISSSWADPQGLPAVRESLTSSSSNSTVREGDRGTRSDKKPSRQPQSIPSPPPRKSSHNFQPTELPRHSPKKVQQGGRQPVVVSPPPLRINTSSTRPKLSSPVSAPPRRPSRDGTPDLQSQFFPLPVIHSNLSTTSLPGERRGSESAPTSALPHSATPLMSLKNASVTHLPLTREIFATSDSGTSNAKSAKPSSAAAVPPVSRTPSPVVASASTSRFPFFGRKKRTTEEAPKVDKKDARKLTRKGPAAGTGHEGYGRIGAIRRRSGSISNFARGAPEPQSSQESLVNNDAFLADRLNPVIIAGGEVIENRNASLELSRIGSNQSMALSQSGAGRRPSLETSTASGAGPRAPHRLADSSRGPRFGLGHRRPSTGSDSDDARARPNLAQRRSVQRLRTSPDSPPLRIPQPINTSGVASSPMTSFDTSIMSDESHIELQREISRGSIDPHPQPKKLMKRTRSPRKWKLFSRSPVKAASRVQEEPVAATVTVVEQKPVAFYTMIETSDPDEDEVLDIREVLQNAEVYMSPTKEGNVLETSSSVPPPPELGPLQIETPSEVQQPAPPPARAIAKPPVPEVPAPPRLDTSVSVGRTSRLPQVGRIPKVVSNQIDHVSPRSFSRPFRTSVLLPSPALEVREQSPLAREQSPLVSSEPLQKAVSEEPASVSSGSVISPAATRGEKDFITFSHRKDSVGTIGTSSSSSGTANAFAVATAVIPKPTDPPAEDEIWDEYNDLLGDDHNKVRASTTSSHGIPFHLETYETKLMKDGKPMESPTIFADTRKLSTYSRAPTHSTSYSADMTERIRAAFQPHNSPPVSAHNSLRPPSHKRQSQSLDLGRKAVIESRRSSSSSCHTRKSIASSCSSDDGSPLAQVNLRVGSMTVSKWLTFGHVLFSDIRHELVPEEGTLKRESILVMDGLGNDDWSFYAAETYPAASFFNLSPRAPLPPELQNSPSSFPLSPPNHHQVQHMSQADKFPFAPQSFTCFVYRFPIAAPESYYRNILTEARRVLKPGGYIELSILDVDLNNMGNHGRRAVRKLKERVREQQPEINLSSTADLIVRLLGKHGFSNIKAARVGVPVASPIASSGSQRKKEKRDQPSLSDMMSDNSAVADENITKMVSRVGRWWYTRCYENAAATSEDKKSIFSDKALLSECQELGTSLKLMVCCARAPERIASI
ncbi:hypothetical protein HJFPF1_07796 [Paramyrothecium foliicola]|nr:hypothetical protein HJFPF1_07796 [Paramyrothecium foliicola]